ncbi:hypothetical protein L7750_19625 [Xenorhabdus bovienii]|uniref:hypothetical protein n=1 Tax=Xenorhabdus bovienii TaxID=40576 RepID=UPI001EE015FA|nr:hypothetical protein [Xenorhabdus bovienii]MCG3472493.1 hypothetical protein [Xenorhabdus bovienii]
MDFNSEAIMENTALTGAVVQARLLYGERALNGNPILTALRQARLSPFNPAIR